MARDPKLTADPGRIVANRDFRRRAQNGVVRHAEELTRTDHGPGGVHAESGMEAAVCRNHHAGRTQLVQTALRKSVLGHATSALDDGKRSIEVHFKIPING